MVLDVSALRAYGTVDGAMAVAELAYMIEEEHADDQIGIPAAAYFAAFTEGDDDCRTELSRLAADVALATDERGDADQSSFAILPLQRDNLTDAAELERRLPGQGHAIVEALRHNAKLATFAPPKQRLRGVEVIDLGLSWNDLGDGWDLSE
jgi:hypothetical protein